MTPSRLCARDLSVGYGDRPVLDHLDVDIPDGSFTVIVGPNACGKSTLLKALSRLLPAESGTVFLDNRDIRSYPSKEVARKLGLLPQAPSSPDGVAVTDLVARGRYPHQRLLRQWSPDDETAVSQAMAATAVTDLADRMVNELSGGQCQRVWLAMVLAQQTDLILLDEPTTFLDIAHQIEVLELCRSLSERPETTLVAVLHDLNQACRYASHLIVMKAGTIVAEGPPHLIMTEDLVSDVFGIESLIVPDPVTFTPMVVPVLERAPTPEFG